MRAYDTPSGDGEEGTFAVNTTEFEARVVPLAHETADIEFKAAGTLDERAAKVIRGALAMANRRNGGIVVVGVGEVNHQLDWTGLTLEQAGTWVPDNFYDKIAAYADPSIDCDVSEVVYDGKTYVTISVAEFDTTPVVCKKDGAGLRQGATYVRPWRKPESVEVPTAADARELHELAAEKLTRRFLATAERVGLLPPEPEDTVRYDSEIGDLWQ